MDRLKLWVVVGAIAAATSMYLLSTHRPNRPKEQVRTVQKSVGAPEATDPELQREINDAIADQQLVRTVQEGFRDQDAQTYPLQNLQVQFEGWMAMARSGDLKAARSIWRAMKTCSQNGSAPYSPESYEDLRKEAKDRAERAGRPLDAAKLRALAIQYAICGNVTGRQRKLALEALNLLADSGDWEGVRDLAEHGRPDVSDRSLNAGNRVLQEHRKKAIELLDAQVARGNVEAMLLKSALHMPPSFTHELSILDADRIRSTAYHLAAHRRLKSIYAQNPPVSAEERQLMAMRIEQLERESALLSLSPWDSSGGMSQQQISEASRLADEILSRCCR